MSYLMVHVVRANKRTRSRSNELYLTSYLCSSMYVRNHEPRMSYVVRRTRYEVIRKPKKLQNNKASLYDERSGACSTWYVVEKLEDSSGSTRTHAWWYYWCCPTLGRIDVAAAVGGGSGVLCLAARFHVGQNVRRRIKKKKKRKKKKKLVEQVAHRHLCQNLPHFFARVCGFTCVWVALSARNASPWLFAIFRDFEPLEHGPWTPAGTKSCTLVSGVFPGRPAAESTRKDSRAEEQNMPMS